VSQVLYNILQHDGILWRRALSVSAKPQAGGPPHVGSPGLLIQYIRSFHPYLEAVSSIRNGKARHDVMKRNISRTLTDICSSVQDQTKTAIHSTLILTVERE
jgi:hypothetical protein